MLILKLIGIWLFCDALYSLRIYWRKEDIFNQGIRAIRLVCAVAIVALG